MSRFPWTGNAKTPSVAEDKRDSLSSWTDVAEGWFLTEEGQLTSMSMMDRDGHTSRSQTHRRGDSLPGHEPTNGLYTHQDVLDTPPSATVRSFSHEIDSSRMTRSMDYGHESLPVESMMGTQPSASDDFSSSSVDYLWDADDLPDSRKFNSLPHTSVYGTTSNGSLPGSPLSSRRSEAADQTEKIKSKLMSAWNNMRHGWTMRRTTSFKYDDPIWILGKHYYSTHSEREDQKERQLRGVSVITSMEKFKRDFTSRLWFTYRKGFPPIPNSQYTSDVGWGCMIRTGQMMIAQALIVHFLGREWWWYPQQRPQDVLYHHQIIRMFGDSPSPDCPFSLHKLVEIGRKMGKNPGDWYGPASVAHVLSEAVLQASNNPIASQICIYVAQDCTVYKQDVLDLCALMGSRRSSFRSRHGSGTSDEAHPASPGERTPVEEPWKAVIILVPVRLGGEALNLGYIPCIRNILTHRMTLGVIGGKPKHSVYFIGWQDDKLIYLDPHFCQENEDVHVRNFQVHSFHCMSPRKLPFKNMDPSCTLGFYCKTRVDFETFIHEAPQLITPVDRGQYPLFVVSEGRSRDVAYKFSSPGKSERTKHKVPNDRLSSRMRENSRESDDFVFL